MSAAVSSRAATYRQVPLGGSLSARFTQRADGAMLVTSTEPLGAYPPRLTDRLLHWAAVEPEHTLAARRQNGGDWRRISYREALHSARCIAQALIDLKLSADRPVAILSDNDLEHLLLTLGAMFAGVPVAPISAAYSIVSQDCGRLRHILGVLTPGLVFASGASAYGRAINASVPADVPVVLTSGRMDGRSTMSFDDLLATVPTAQVDAAHAKVGPDTIAKFLFTSGSTKLPKGVVNTQRMLCSNQQMILQCFPVLGHERPVLVDWLPWNHTFGGNHNIGLTLYNGGTLYIDDGKPVPALIGETLRNLREIAPTMYFNVPKGFEEIAAALELDAALRDRFFSRVKMLFFAGAGLSQPVWDKLDRMAELACGERIRILTGLGMTETAPFAICANGADVKSGHIGLPAPGMTLKLAPVDGKLEVRYAGPNVTPGYWRAPAQTAESFDAEGFYWLKDIVPVAEKAGIKMVATERFARADTSVTGQALKLVAANPDAILVVASGSGAAMPHKGLVERGYAKGKIYQTHGAASFDLIRVGGADVEGSYVVSGPAVVALKLPDSNASKVLGVKYVTDYEKAYGKGMANQFGAHAFDVVIVLEKAIPLALKKARPGTREFRAALKEALETMGRTPVSQGVLNFTATDHFGYTPETGVMLKIVSGEWQVVPN